jgi:hypothetical protein
VHNATEMVWRPRTFFPFNSTSYPGLQPDGPFATAGYKLMKRYPSASTTGPANTYGYYDVGNVVKVIEDSATPGVNFSQHVSNEFTYTENSVDAAAPTWIAQDIHAPSAGTDAGVYRYPNKVNTFSFSYWCADCHNLNIGGWEPLAEVELGFKAHNERTHPAPFYGAYDGPGHCFSCHRNDLSTVFGNAAVYGGTAQASLRSSSNSCTQCHYGSGSYYNDRADADPAKPNSDFPHSGSANSIKLLGDYSVESQTNFTNLVQTTVTENNLDAVCLRCHPGIGVHN